ncbi:MAG: universal stress protein [Candidatus Nanopelagicales bacterium]
MERILVAVDDSPAGLAAARAAIRLARLCPGALRAVHVLVDGVLVRELERGAGAVGVRERRGQATAAVLRHVVDLAAQAGVAVETVAYEGEPAACILREAAAWPADVVVVGRSGGGPVGHPYVGSEVREVLEFAEVPVLVVPPP